MNFHRHAFAILRTGDQTFMSEYQIGGTVDRAATFTANPQLATTFETKDGARQFGDDFGLGDRWGEIVPVVVEQTPNGPIVFLPKLRERFRIRDAEADRYVVDVGWDAQFVWSSDAGWALTWASTDEARRFESLYRSSSRWLVEAAWPTTSITPWTPHPGIVR